jgi:hypothetical protein
MLMALHQSNSNVTGIVLNKYTGSGKIIAVMDSGFPVVFNLRRLIDNFEEVITMF